jgi:hypothetical protein
MIQIALALELESCKKILSLRSRYQKYGPFFVYLPINMVYNKSNFRIVKERLPILAATHSSFDMELSDLHRTYRTKKKAVKYSLQSTALDGLRRDAGAQFADARVHCHSTHIGFHPPRPIIALGEDMKLNPRGYSSPLNVAVQNKIVGDEEADRVLREVQKLDPKTLGPLTAIGLEFYSQLNADSPFNKGGFFPFPPKS